MDIRIFNTFEEASRFAADRVCERILAKPNLVLGLATGETPLQLYRELVERFGRGDVDFSKVTTFNLDEYLGLPPDHPQSYRYFMDRNLISHINIPRERTHVLDGMTRDAEKTCREYEAAIAEAGGIDIQILGIGGSGHIAFNEPGSTFDSRTRVVDLSEDTIRANSDGRFFKDPAEVPRQALSMGLGTIMEAKEILLLASGKRKANAIRTSLEGLPTPDVPASILQRHRAAHLFIDGAAAFRLTQTTSDHR